MESTAIDLLAHYTNMTRIDYLYAAASAAFGGTLLAVVSYKKDKPMSICDLIRKFLIGGTMGLVILKLGHLAANMLKPFEEIVRSSLNSTPNINVELITEVGSITGASVAPVLVYKIIPGSRFGVMLGNYVVNTVRLSKHSAVYSKVVFVGLMLLRSR